MFLTYLPFLRSLRLNSTSNINYKTHLVINIGYAYKKTKDGNHVRVVFKRKAQIQILQKAESECTCYYTRFMHGQATGCA